jgi:hypothetical protein
MGGRWSVIVGGRSGGLPMTSAAAYSKLPSIFPLLSSWLVAMNFDGELIAGVTDRHEAPRRSSGQFGLIV